MKKITGPVANWRRLVVIPPTAWLVLEAIATIVWLIAIAWSGYTSARWLFI
jgi:hypothetical protein